MCRRALANQHDPSYLYPPVALLYFGVRARRFWDAGVCVGDPIRCLETGGKHGGGRGAGSALWEVGLEVKCGVRVCLTEGRGEWLDRGSSRQCGLDGV